MRCAGPGIENVFHSQKLAPSMRPCSLQWREEVGSGTSAETRKVMPVVLHLCSTCEVTVHWRTHMSEKQSKLQVDRHQTSQWRRAWDVTNTHTEEGRVNHVLRKALYE